MGMDVQTQRQLHRSPNHQCQDGIGKLIRCSAESSKTFDELRMLRLLRLAERPAYCVEKRCLSSMTFIILLIKVLKDSPHPPPGDV